MSIEATASSLNETPVASTEDTNYYTEPLLNKSYVQPAPTQQLPLDGIRTFEQALRSIRIPE